MEDLGRSFSVLSTERDKTSEYRCVGRCTRTWSTNEKPWLWDSQFMKYAIWSQLQHDRRPKTIWTGSFLISRATHSPAIIKLAHTSRGQRLSVSFLFLGLRPRLWLQPEDSWLALSERWAGGSGDSAKVVVAMVGPSGILTQRMRTKDPRPFEEGWNLCLCRQWVLRGSGMRSSTMLLVEYILSVVALWL